MILDSVSKLKLPVKNKVLLIVIGVLFLLALFGYLLQLFDPFNQIGIISLKIGNFAKILGILLLVQNGTMYKKTGVLSLTFLFFSILIIGYMFKIMHWFFADQLLLISFTGIGLVYLFYFIGKKNKKSLDFLKALWVISLCLILPLVIFHILKREFIYIPELLFWLTISNFALNEYKTKKEEEF